jgi:hypothetical protein
MCGILNLIAFYACRFEDRIDINGGVLDLQIFYIIADYPAVVHGRVVAHVDLLFYALPNSSSVRGFFHVSRPANGTLALSGMMVYYRCAWPKVKVISAPGVQAICGRAVEMGAYGNSSGITL